MIRTFVPLAAVLLTACATPSLSQDAVEGCRFSPNPRSVHMHCPASKSAQAPTSADVLCPGSLNPKHHGSVFCARSDSE